jgi:hypothetical protein
MPLWRIPLRHARTAAQPDPSINRRSPAGGPKTFRALRRHGPARDKPLRNRALSSQSPSASQALRWRLPTASICCQFIGVTVVCCRESNGVAGPGSGSCLAGAAAVTVVTTKMSNPWPGFPGSLWSETASGGRPQGCRCYFAQVISAAVMSDRSTRQGFWNGAPTG